MGQNDTDNFRKTPQFLGNRPEPRRGFLHRPVQNNLLWALDEMNIAVYEPEECMKRRCATPKSVKRFREQNETYSGRVRASFAYRDVFLRKVHSCVQS